MTSSSEPAGVLAGRLTTDGKLKFAPAFAGRDEVVFAVHDVPNQVILKRLRLPAKVQEPVYPGMPEHQFDPAYSRDGRYHCFIQSAGSPQLVLIIRNRLDGKEARVVPQDARAVARAPSLAPDGARVVFHLSDSGGQQIASVDSLGRDLRRLTSAAGIYASPAVSPDGGRIAFASSRDGDFEIYVMEADGSRTRRLTQSPGLDLRPAWSPDGSRIAFTSNRDGFYAIYVMRDDGTGLRRVTAHPERQDYPAWHPDGRHLLLVSEHKGKCDLHLVPVPG